MQNHELLEQIQEQWLSRLADKLTGDEAVRKLIRDELTQFYELLLKAVESGDAVWLKPILIAWAQTRTQGEMEEVVSVPPVLSRIFEETQTLLRELFGAEKALDVIGGLTPIFAYAYEQIAHQETLVRISYISTELEMLRKQLERLDRSKSDFIAVAAHELKTPLTLIDGYTSMLNNQLGGDGENPQEKMLLNGISKGIDRLGEIINDMIDISMLENNMMDLNFQPTWINRLLKALEKELVPLAAERKLTFEVIEFAGWDTMTFADSERIHQALRNVLTNAIKYTPDGGSVIVDGRYFSGIVEVVVRDTGIGLDIEDQATIFRKFGRLGETATHSSGKTKFKGGGPGLGLPITKGILEAHGGTIWVESEGYDEDTLPGSTFHILIPVRA
ncbi:MAG: HAMP domain-containing histidine kinase, partial [Anaerolineae bacterium]|nr:HAMP domain-containing histidine kinase [Anaerolineae bacterium]